jgi:hypothetical protein
MMSKILLLASILLLNQAWAQEAEEEAIILNQEMKFLEESAQSAPIISATRPKNQNNAVSAINEDSLERKYFGSEQDTISNKTAAPKRRAP